MKRIATFALAAIATLALGACQVGPKTASQNGVRGTGMDQIQLKKVALAKDEVPAPPYDPPTTEGQKAKEVYQRLQEQTVAAAKATDKAVRENPYQALGIAFGVGLLIGIVATRCRCMRD